MMRITITPGCKKLVPKPPHGHFRPKPQRYYNYAVSDDGNPYGADFVREVPRDAYHLRLLVQNDWIKLADDMPAPAPTPKPKPKAGGEK
jgi:hypothetical protein